MKNTKVKQRLLKLYEEYENKIVAGSSTLKPRCENVDIIMPFPRPKNADSIYRIQERTKVRIVLVYLSYIDIRRM